MSMNLEEIWHIRIEFPDGTPEDKIRLFHYLMYKLDFSWPWVSNIKNEEFAEKLKKTRCKNCNGRPWYMPLMSVDRLNIVKQIGYRTGLTVKILHMKKHRTCSNANGGHKGLYVPTH